MEIAIPVTEMITGMRDFSPQLCAHATLKESCSELYSVYAKVREWIEEEYLIAEAPFEIYTTDPSK